MSPNLKPWFLRALAVVVLGGLLYWALRNAPLAEIWAAVSSLQLWQIVMSPNGVPGGTTSVRPLTVPCLSGRRPGRRRRNRVARAFDCGR